ncbi:MAG: hypothetical protein ACLTSX_12635 [Collinsella sp.]
MIGGDRARNQMHAFKTGVMLGFACSSSGVPGLIRLARVIPIDDGGRDRRADGRA